MTSTMGSTPAIIAHRGASREWPENSMRAFRRAVELGCDAIELDVHATRDGTVVVHHDFDAATASGDRVRLAATERSALGSLRGVGAEAIPTLDDVLEAVAGSLTVYVEVKGEGIEAQVAACLGRHPGTATAVHAFDHRIPIAVRRTMPASSSLAIGLLSSSYLLDTAAAIRAAGAGAWWQHQALIDRELVAEVHGAGAQLIAWTVNSVDRARELAAWGVDALCTDDPALIASALRR